MGVCDCVHIVCACKIDTNPFVSSRLQWMDGDSNTDSGCVSAGDECSRGARAMLGIFEKPSTEDIRDNRLNLNVYYVCVWVSMTAYALLLRGWCTVKDIDEPWTERMLGWTTWLQFDCRNVDLKILYKTSHEHNIHSVAILCQRFWSGNAAARPTCRFGSLCTHGLRALCVFFRKRVIECGRGNASPRRNIMGTESRAWPIEHSWP